MIEFVNAKINIGLQIVGKREDGYHNLQTVFYPIGKYSGLPDNPNSFCDILEITPEIGNDIRFEFRGRMIDCPPEKNLVFRAARLYKEGTGMNVGMRIYLEKHLPDGAGLGGGSADAAFTLKALATLQRETGGISPSEAELAGMALRLGADCPFFIYNRPMLGEGIGEVLTDISLDLSGYWVLVVKPRIYVSTKEAFSGIVPHEGGYDLSLLSSLPINEWQGRIKNDFEESLFPLYPELKRIKNYLIKSGAEYASMSGSGSSIYGIFREKGLGEQVKDVFMKEPTIEGAYLLKL